LNVAHRDIKPDNFLVQKLPDQSTRVVLSDFGLSTTPQTEQAPGANCCGTTSYKAPEIVANKNLGTAGSEVNKKMPKRTLHTSGWAINTHTKYNQTNLIT
jgi:serine/threonine protein kinase